MGEQDFRKQLISELAAIRLVLSNLVHPLHTLADAADRLRQGQSFSDKMNEDWEKQSKRQREEQMLRETKVQNLSLVTQNKILFLTLIATLILGFFALLINTFFQYQEYRLRSSSVVIHGQLEQSFQHDGK